MKLKAVIFDLDGTLTEPYLDFDRIRAEIGDIDGPILEAMERMSVSRRQRAEAILARHERLAASASKLNPGAAELLATLRSAGLRIGLVTRNSPVSVETVCRLHDLRFDSVCTRCDGPVKPDAFAVLHTCGVLAVAPSESVLVGDYLFDMLSGRSAGCHTVLLKSSGRYDESLPHADYAIDSLVELTEVMAKIETAA